MNVGINRMSNIFHAHVAVIKELKYNSFPSFNEPPTHGRSEARSTENVTCLFHSNPRQDKTERSLIQLKPENHEACQKKDTWSRERFALVLRRTQLKGKSEETCCKTVHQEHFLHGVLLLECWYQHHFQQYKRSVLGW
jgi:hypothetical protein